MIDRYHDKQLKKNGGQQLKLAKKYKQLDKCLDQSDSCRRSVLTKIKLSAVCLYIICRILLTSNYMIFLEQFGINKHL